jgi:hypothetical protein
MSVGAPGRYYLDDVFPLGIDDVENAAFNHAYDHKTFLAVVLSVVKNFYGERILEHPFGQFKADSVFDVVGLGFGVVPFDP